MTELGLSIPVAGVQLIEASAGTGKTFTVATLYTRLVVELGLPVAKLLAVTDERMDFNSSKPGAKELAGAF